MKHVTKNNTTAFIEISQRDLTNRRVLLRDTCLVWPRTFTEGLTPTEIDSNNYYTKSEVDEKIADVSRVVTSGTTSSTTINLVEGELVTHVPDSTTTYTLPAITDLTKTHECTLEIDFTNVQTLTIDSVDSKTVSWLEAFTPTVGLVARFNIFYSNLKSSWMVQPTKYV